MKKVYTIGILDFVFDHTTPEYMHHEVKLMDTRTKEVFYDKLSYIYLEMPKFNKEEGELVTIFDKWLYAIKNLATLMERPAALQEAIFSRFFEQAEIAKFSPEELRDYRESQKDFWDMFAVTETAERKKAKQIANNMKEKGMPTNIIAECTGLTEEEISKLYTYINSIL